MKRFMQGITASLALILAIWLFWCIPNFLETQPSGASELATKLDNLLDQDGWTWHVSQPPWGSREREWIGNGKVQIIEPENYYVPNSSPEIHINREDVTHLLSNAEQRALFQKAARIAHWLRVEHKRNQCKQFAKELP